MIYTFTLNPALDYYITLPQEIMCDEVNRGSNETYKAGGKGLNVSKVLSLLNIPSTAVCLLGGFTGQYIQSCYQDNKYIHLGPIQVNGPNRINVKANHGKHAFVINGQGPQADNNTKRALLDDVKHIQKDDYAIISGSMMKGLDSQFLIDLCTAIHQQSAKLVLDMEISDTELLQKCHPFLIKPNLYELQKLMHNPDITKQNAAAYAKQLHLENVLVSLGPDGALFVHKDDVYKMNQPDTVMVNKVGAGDAMLAAFIGKLAENKSIEEALQYAGAAGNATASMIQDITLQDIQYYLQFISVTRII